MLDSFIISFRLKITYRVNGFLYSLKCVPLLGRLLPDRLYCVRGLKILAGIFAGLWELVSMFLGKFLYLCCRQGFIKVTRGRFLSIFWRCFR